jgi:hypothetical protein
VRNKAFMVVAADLVNDQTVRMRRICAPWSVRLDLGSDMGTASACVTP